MTDELRARLEADQRIIDAATYGPWRKYLRHDGMEHDDGSSSYVSAIYPGVEQGPLPVFLTNGIDKRDATFIAASRTRWEQANRALLAVLELHRPRADDDPDTAQCGGCLDIDPGGYVPYPCPTVHALTEKLTGEDNG